MIRALKNKRGIALVAVIMLMAILLVMSGAALLLGGLNLRTASNFKLGTMTLQAADAGVQHALTKISWGTIFTYSSQATLLDGYAFTNGYTYTVTAINDATSPGGNTRLKLTAAGRGPDDSKKVILAYVARGWGGGPGAIYLPGPATNIETRFVGDNFRIHGEDTNVNGTPGPEGARLGISTTDQAMVTEITDNDLVNGGLSAQQMDNVTGAGGAPSVGVIPPLDQTVTQVADKFLTFPHETFIGSNFENGTWGTDANPQITYLLPDPEHPDRTITINGTTTGTGVLIVDGNVKIDGNVDFHGLIIAKGKVSIDILGSVVVHGSVFVAEQSSPDVGDELLVGGHAEIYYSSQTLAQVNSNWGNTLPQPARLVAWQEVM